MRWLGRIRAVDAAQMRPSKRSTALLLETLAHAGELTHATEELRVERSPDGSILSLVYADEDEHAFDYNWGLTALPWLESWGCLILARL